MYMKTFILTLTLVLAAANAFADQAATITCTGKNVILSTKTPYWGEGSKATQTLYTLKSVENFDESVSTAFFLDVDAEGDVDKYGMIYSEGKNSAGGSFLLKTKFWEDVGDGTIINEVTTGVITYQHGSLKGKDEPVSCTKN